MQAASGLNGLLAPSLRRGRESRAMAGQEQEGKASDLPRVERRGGKGVKSIYHCRRGEKEVTKDNYKNSGESRPRKEAAANLAFSYGTAFALSTSRTASTSTSRLFPCVISTACLARQLV